jgi:hypothetical protein
VGAIHRQLPFQAEVAFGARVGVRGDDRHEQAAVMDLLADLVIPDIPAAQLALVEPHLDPGSPQRLADTPRRLGILRGIAQEHSP